MNLKKKPGVYMGYTAVSANGKGLSEKSAALIMFDDLAEEIGGKSFGSAIDMKKDFSEPKNKKLLDGAEILFKEGVRKVYVYFAKDKLSVGNCLLNMEEKEDIGGIVLDELLAEFKKDANEHAKKMTEAKKERMIFLGLENVSLAVAAARELNSERAVVTAGKGSYGGKDESFYLSAFMAAVKLSQTDPTRGLSLLETKTIEGIFKNPTDEEIETAISGGVTVFEKLPHAVCLVKALTTRTKNGEIEDRSLCPLTNVLKADYISERLKNMLYGLIKSLGGKLNYDCISSQICVLMTELREEGLIESFEVPKIYPVGSDSSVCAVELSFKLSVSVDTIHINTRLVI